MIDHFQLGKETEKFVNRRCDIKKYPRTIVSVYLVETERESLAFKAFLRDPDTLSGTVVAVDSPMPSRQGDGEEVFMDLWYKHVAAGLERLHAPLPQEPEYFYESRVDIQLPLPKGIGSDPAFNETQATPVPYSLCTDGPKVVLEFSKSAVAVDSRVPGLFLQYVETLVLDELRS